MPRRAKQPVALALISTTVAVLLIKVIPAGAAGAHAKRTARPPWAASEPAVVTAAAAGTVFTVNDTGDTPDANAGNGTCADAGGKCTLRAAIQEANALSGDDAINFSVTGTITLASALPDLSTNINISGPGLSVLTIRRDAANANQFRIFKVNAGATVSISGVTFTGGHTPDVGSSDPEVSRGGGINNAGTLTLTDVAVSGNETRNGNNLNDRDGGWGGGISNSGTLTLANSTVALNRTGRGVQPATADIFGKGGSGGGIFNSGTLNLTNSLVQSNFAGNGGPFGDFGGDGGDGGGIFNSGMLALTNSTVTNNQAGSASAGIPGHLGGSGGGIYSSGALTLTNSTVNTNLAGNGGVGFNNSGGGNGGSGGGVSNAGTLTLTNSTVSGNLTGGGGNGAFGSHNDGKAGDGAGVFNSSTAALTLTNCTITNNRTAFGGINDGSLGVSGLGVGGGIRTRAGAPLLRNTIVAGNFRGRFIAEPERPDDINGTVNSSSSFNLIGAGGAGGLTDGAGGNHVGVADARLAPLANNGGPAQTHALLAGSPALDAGDNTTATNAGLTTDQRGAGFSRFADSDDADTTATVDIGAFEAQVSVQDIPDKATNEDAPLSFQFGISGGVSSAAVTATSDNQALVPGANLRVTGASPPLTLSVTPAPNQFGSATITVTAARGGQSMTDTFLLTVNSVNDPPSFTKGPDQTTAVGAATQTVANWATNLSAGPPNESGQSLAFVVTSNSNPGVFSVAPAVSPSGTLTYKPSASAAGTATLTLALKDDGGTAGGGSDTSPPQTFKITVNPSDTSTALTSSPNPSDTGQAVTFRAAVTASAPGAAAPQGTVTFKEGATALGTATLDASGAATLVLSSLSGGDHSIAAQYGGSVGFNASASGALTQAVRDGGVISFTQSLYAVAEPGGSVSITVMRTGAAATRGATVEYATDDGSVPAVFVPCSAVTGLASERCDYTRAAGTLQFAAGETEKSFTVLVNDDSYTEGPETLSLKLSNPSGGAALGQQSSATLRITDDAPESSGNPVDDSAFFVRQHYHDFLGREPDAAGLQFWTQNIESCGADAACREVKRVDTSAAFFLSIEFQNTGYFVERVYKAAYGDASVATADGQGGTAQLAAPIIRLREFLPDRQEIGQGVVVGQGGWRQQLDDNKQAFVFEFVQRARFAAAFPPSLTADQFVSKLDANAGLVLSPAEKAGLAAELGATPADAARRADVLRKVADNADLQRRELDRAFVLMQYFGYLRRDPDSAPDSNYSGSNFWLTKLDGFGGDFRQAEMVKAFTSSTEYRQRFGQ